MIYNKTKAMAKAKKSNQKKLACPQPHTLCNHDIHTLHLHGLLMIMCDNAFRVFELEQWGWNRLCVCFCLTSIIKSGWNKNKTIYMYKRSKKHHKLKKKYKKNEWRLQQRNTNSICWCWRMLPSSARLAVSGFSKTKWKFHFKL